MPAPPAHVVAPIAEQEIPQVAEFLARNVPAGEAQSENPLPPVERLRWLLLDNPWRREDVPLGWRIVSEGGAVVGACVFSPFKLSNTSGAIVDALMFSKFYVDEPYRGMGLGLLMRFVREGKRFVLFCTSTNAIAGQLFAKVGAKQINGLDHTMLGVANLRPLAEEQIYRKTHIGALARTLALPTAIAGNRMRRLAMTRKDAMLTPINSAGELSSMNRSSPSKLTAIVRDEKYLHWRYFSGQRDKRVFAYHCEGEDDRLVVVNEVRAGYRGQIRVLNVLDAWPPTTPVSAPRLCGALAGKFAGRFDSIWLRSQPADAENALHEAGFVRRTFPAPLGWYIDAEHRLTDPNWYIMPGESE